MSLIGSTSFGFAQNMTRFSKYGIELIVVLSSTNAIKRDSSIKPFPHDKILDQTKFKAFADNKLNVTKMIISVFDRVENIVGKGEIACTSNFSFSHNVFKRLLS